MLINAPSLPFGRIDFNAPRANSYGLFLLTQSTPLPRCSNRVAGSDNRPWPMHPVSMSCILCPSLDPCGTKHMLLQLGLLSCPRGSSLLLAFWRACRASLGARLQRLCNVVPGRRGSFANCRRAQNSIVARHLAPH